MTLLGAKAQLAQLIQKVVNASTLPPAVKTQLIATLQSRLPSFYRASRHSERLFAQRFRCSRSG